MLCAVVTGYVQSTLGGSQVPFLSPCLLPAWAVTAFCPFVCIWRAHGSWLFWHSYELSCNLFWGTVKWLVISLMSLDLAFMIFLVGQSRTECFNYSDKLPEGPCQWSMCDKQSSMADGSKIFCPVQAPGIVPWSFANFLFLYSCSFSASIPWADLCWLFEGDIFHMPGLSLPSLPTLDLCSMDSSHLSLHRCSSLFTFKDLALVRG